MTADPLFPANMQVGEPVPSGGSHYVVVTDPDDPRGIRHIVCWDVNPAQARARAEAIAAMGEVVEVVTWNLEDAVLLEAVENGDDGADVRTVLGTMIGRSRALLARLRPGGDDAE